MLDGREGRYGPGHGGHGGGGGRRGRGERRQPPPEVTGEEARYLHSVRENADPLTAHLVDGEAFRGVVEYYDTDVIKLVPDRGPGRLLRKREIRYLAED